MLRNLRKVMDDRNISTKLYGAQIGVVEKSAYNKIMGLTELTIGEARKTMELFPEYNMEWLLKNYEDDNPSGESIAG